MKWSHRYCKKQLKALIRRVKILETHGRTFVIAKNPSVLCTRWGSYIAVAIDHPQLHEMITEGKLSLSDAKKLNKVRWEEANGILPSKS